MAYRFNPFTNQLDFYQEDTQFVSSGAIANLTSGQQDAIREGSIVTTTDGRRWVYSGTGSKTAEASYVELADITPEWSVIANKPAIPTAAPAAGQIMAGNAGGTAFATVSVSGDATLDSTGALTIAAGAVGTSKLGGDITTAGKALLDDADALAQRTTLGLGNSATLNTGTSAGTVATGDHTHTQLHDRSHAITSTSDHTAGNHKVFYSNGSGEIVELPLGSSGQVLTSNGTSSAPSFATASGGITAIGTSAADALSISGSDLVADDPGADRILFWDDSADKLTHLEVGTGLSISGTTLSVTGGVTTGSTDNAILRADGTGGSTSQSSAIVIDDATTSTQANVAIVNAHSETNSALVLSPKGTGAFIVGPKPDGTATGGNARGNYAIDLQLIRASSSAVASGLNSIAIGRNCTATSAGNNDSNTYSIAIGHTTSATGNQSTSIGFGNTSSSTQSIAIGTSNQATAAQSVCIGNGSIASGTGAVAIGGSGILAQNANYTTAIGGQSNNSYGAHSGIFSGSSNQCSGSHAAVFSGATSHASATHSVLFGPNVLSDRRGMFAHGGGQFAAQGDAQRARFVLRNKTTTNAAVELFLDGSATRLTIPSGKTIGGTIQIAGASSGGEEAVHYIRQFLIRNRGGTTALIGSIQTVGTDIESTGLSACSVTLTADDTNDSLKVEVEGPAALTGCTIEADDDIITKTAHGLTADTDIVFTSLTGGAGLTANTVTYWVRDVTTDSFKVSATRGGAAVNITTDYTDATVARVVRWVANVDATEIGFGT